MINIVIPMAGRGSRFKEAGYKDPKPLIKINSKFMIEGVIDNLTPKNNNAHFIFICQQDHLNEYDLEKKLNSRIKNLTIIAIDEITEGAACTVLKAEKYINNNSELMIANSDQWVDTDIDQYISHMNKNNLDGLIMTMNANDSKWSYAKENIITNLVEKVEEKKVISNEATVGIYNFKYGSDFCSAANQMINLDKKINGEFYVAPVYNELIVLKKRIGIFNIGSLNNGMYGLGTPEDLDAFKLSEKLQYF